LPLRLLHLRFWWRARLDARSGAGMNRKWVGKSISTLGLLAVAVWLSSLSSCARSQKLVGITIFPSGFTYGQSVPAGITQTPIPLTAYGAFIHPPETKVITDNVTWASDVTAVANVDSAGNLTAGPGCGTANISATDYTNGNKSGNVVVGFISVTVDGPASLGCTPAGPPTTLTVQFSGGGTGTVISNPPGIECSAPSTCTSSSFTVGQTILLTATATGTSIFQSWNGCNATNGQACTVILESSVTVTATITP
jgi:hypothetical protein